uniref:FAD-binding protein n=1 Tax=Volvariella volvacea TaxID=36659 RepID=M9ZBN5_9AGAR|nr:FAD-binding protein [Volvariella volvacea]
MASSTIEKILEELSKSISPKANFFPPGTTGYEAVTNSYFWGSSIQNPGPAAVLQPGDAEDVSKILKAISGADYSVSFAIKAGSHIAPTGFNSTSGGILIDMALFDKITYHKDTTLVDLGPGLLWEPRVYSELAKYGRNVNGATSCKGVGVAGFNLGGGYGNKTNQFGLAMDTIKAIEVVLPSGKIKTVSENSDRDLFRALKGGGNNFGIVTKWTMETHEQGPIYFKMINYEHKYFDRVQAAIWAYIQKQVPKSNVETKFEWTPTPRFKVHVISHAELFYDGPEPPKDLFKEFLDIPPITETQSESGTWKELMKSLPNEVAKGLKDNGGVQFYPDIWPGSPTMFKNSPPSAWPHGPEALFPLPVRCMWQGKENDKYWLDTLASFTEEIRQFAVKQGCTKDGVPTYYNLALDGTDVSLIYRDNLPHLINVRAQYDKLGVMNRTGGFRIPHKPL